MPALVEYDLVVEQLARRGMRCVYHNSGAFAFVDESSARSTGWIGPDDPTIRPEARSLARRIPPPFERNLARGLGLAWRQHVGGRAWLMPASHWAFELQFGSTGWLPGLLESIAINPHVLRDTSDATGIEFIEAELEGLELVAGKLLELLVSSDFTIVSPDRPLLCRLHHHKQLWWTSTDRALLAGLEAVADTLAGR